MTLKYAPLTIGYFKISKITIELSQEKFCLGKYKLVIQNIKWGFGFNSNYEQFQKILKEVNENLLDLEIKSLKIFESGGILKIILEKIPREKFLELGFKEKKEVIKLH